MSTKHTPGPWTACANYPHGLTMVCDYAGGAGPFLPVADCAQRNTIEEDEANARLIAAAPDAHELLSYIASDSWGAGPTDIGWAKRRAQEWLAKATGSAA